jgi:hypothetical protein
MNVVQNETGQMNSSVATNEIQRIEQQASEVLDQSMLLRIFDADSFSRATHFLKDLKAVQVEISEAFDPVIQAQHQAHKKSLEAKRRYSQPLLKAEGIVKEKIKDYHLEQERIRQEEEDRLNREAKNAEEDRLLQLAEQAERAGDSIEAEAILKTPVIAPVISLSSQTKGQGVSYREVWKFRIINADLIPNAFKVVDERKIGGVVRALKDKTNIPGIEVYCDKAVAIRRA